MPDYRALHLFIRYGRWLALLVVAGGACLIGWTAATMSVAWPLLATAAICVGLLGFFVLVFLDLTKVMAEMLLPR